MKKILVMACSVIILAAIAISGTIAYFTDSDEATNVFTVGNVVIKLIEQQRDLDDNGNPIPSSTLEPFEDNKNLMPLVGKIEETDNQGLPTASNFQDKIVTVKNTGKSDAYVRVYVGVPKELDTKGALHFVDGSKYNATTPTTDYTFTKSESVASDDNYNYYCFTLDKALAVGDTTGAAIVGFYLDSAVDYKDEDKSYYIGDKSVATNKLNFDLSQDVKIPVYVQAVQTAGFENAGAEAAFNEAFKNTVPWGGSSSTTPSATPAPGNIVNEADFVEPTLNANGEYEISTAAQLFGFANAVNNGNTTFANNSNVKVKLTANISLNNDQLWTPIGKCEINGASGAATPGNCFKGTFDGGEHTIYYLTVDISKPDEGNIYADYGAQGLFGYCEGTIQNLTLDHANIIGGWIGGIAGYLGSGSIENCTVSNSTITGIIDGPIGYVATAGAIVGQAGANASLTNCTASNCKICGAQNLVGRIAGKAYSAKVNGCTAPNNTKAYYRSNNADVESEDDIGTAIT